jgi:hypothetical protein
MAEQDCKLEAIYSSRIAITSRTRAKEHHVLRGWVEVDDEVLITRHRVKTGFLFYGSGVDMYLISLPFRDGEGSYVGLL